MREWRFCCRRFCLSAVLLLVMLVQPLSLSHVRSLWQRACLDVRPRTGQLNRYVCVCACLYVCACVRACVCLCARARARVCVSVRTRQRADWTPWHPGCCCCRCCCSRHRRCCCCRCCEQRTHRQQRRQPHGGASDGGGDGAGTHRRRHRRRHHRRRRGEEPGRWEQAEEKTESQATPIPQHQQRRRPAYRRVRVACTRGRRAGGGRKRWRAGGERQRWRAGAPCRRGARRGRPTAPHQVHAFHWHRHGRGHRYGRGTGHGHPAHGQRKHPFECGCGVGSRPAWARVLTRDRKGVG